MLSGRATIFTKIILLLLVFSLFNIAFFFTMVFENQTELISELSALSSKVAALEFRSFLAQNPLSATNTMKRLMKAHSISNFTVFQTSPELKALYTLPASPLPKELPAEERSRLLKTTFKSEFADMIFHQKLENKNRALTLYLPFQNSEGAQRIARFSTVLARFDQKFSLLVRQMLLGGLFILVAYFVLFFFTNRIIVNPIKTLTRKTTDIAAGNFNTRVELLRQDEIGNLGSNFNEMAVAVQRLNFEALNANPLTNLPGNNMIVADIEKRLETGERFAILYCDLDNFKAYNDKYGFVRGDHVILYSSDVFTKAVQELALPATFVGHEGGDDFVVVTRAEFYPELAEKIIESFDAGISQFYNKDDQKNGYIVSRNREGLTRRFPFVGVSIGIVTNLDVEFSSYPEIITVAADMKKHAKSISGSSYSANRRKNL